MLEAKAVFHGNAFAAIRSCDGALAVAHQVASVLFLASRPTQRTISLSLSTRSLPGRFLESLHRALRRTLTPWLVIITTLVFKDCDCGRASRHRVRGSQIARAASLHTL